MLYVPRGLPEFRFPMASKHPASRTPKKSRRGWVVLAVIFGVMIVGGILGRVASPVLVIAVLLAAGLGIFTIVKGAAPRVGMTSRKSGFLALGTAALLVLGGGAANATPQNTTQGPTASMKIVSEPKAPAHTKTPEPKPTTFDEVDVDTPIPFERTTVDDPAITEGTTAVTTAGVEGTKRTTYKVTYVDGVEVAREVTAETVALAPVTEVTTRGTLKPQPVTKPAPLAQAGGGCDSNYSGACVPIASDVDCAGGTGDGPAYLSGTAHVVGRDVYQLDRDKDGIACN
jgi:hypothetical protein